MSPEWTDWYAREDPREWVLPRILDRRAQEHPDRPYLRFEDGPWRTYGEVAARANRMAGGLIARGVEPGESVSVMLPNCEEFVPVWYGILGAGGVMSSINTAYKGDFLTWTVNLVESRVLVISDEYLDRLELVAKDLTHLRRVIVWSSGRRAGDEPAGLECEPLEAVEEGGSDALPAVEHSWTDDARIMFTSGTTGRSKGVIKQHAADYFSARSSIEAMRVRRGVSMEDLADEVYFSCLPLFHSNAQVLCAYPALLAGARVAFVERFSTTRFWEQVIAAEATTFNSIGAMIYFLWNAPPSDLDRAHRVHSVMAAPAPKDVYEAFEERFGITFGEGYGLTETGVATMMDPTRPPRLGSCGVANPGYEVSIVEPGTDRPLPAGEAGEIVVDQRIPNIIMRAYYGMPEKTADDFRNLKLHTGDLGRMDDDGYVYFMDRVKDYIRRRGENVSSMEVEKQVNSHPGVRECAAIAVKAGEGASSEDEI
ncbi:MAG: AMP-binding protein, partial [Miltoncostaeaceae bacterium]